MDIATVAGLLLGSFMVIYGMGENAGLFVNIPSVLIVAGGTVGSLLVSFPIKEVLNSYRPLSKCFKFNLQEPKDLIRRLVEFAEIARRDGILALESVTGDIEDPFLIKGIQLAVDGTDPELIEQILTSELETLEERHAANRKVFEILGKYCPAWGMIGTLIGLVIMLAQLENPETIGPAMAVALITTFYGAIAANFIFLPLADKLQKRHDEEMLLKIIILRGVMAIQSGDNPRIVGQRLEIFLPPEERKGRGK